MKPATPGQWINAVWLTGISSVLFSVMLAFSSYIASVPYISQEWGLSNAQAAMVFSAYLVGYAISSLVLVPLTDRFRPRSVFLIGVVLIAVSNLLFPLLARDFWTGVLLRFLAGAGHVGVYMTGVQLVSLRYPENRRGTAVGVFVSASYAGTTISYVFMGWLLGETDSWRLAYFVTALVGLVGVGLALLLTRRQGLAGNRLAEAPGRGAGRLYLGVVRHRSVALVTLAYALHTAELYIARMWLPLLLGAAFVQGGKSVEEAVPLAAALAGFMFVMGIAGVFVGGLLSDYLGRSAGAALLFALSGACSFVVGWLLGLPMIFMIAVGFLYGFFTAADSAIYSTAVTELSPRDRIGSAQAVQSFIGFTFGAVAPVVAGAILDVAQLPGAWGLVFSFNGALAVMGVLSLLWLRRLPQAVRMQREDAEEG